MAVRSRCCDRVFCKAHKSGKGRHAFVAAKFGKICKRGDVFRDGVNVTTRLEALAEPGTTCLESRFDRVRDRLALDYEDLGEH